MGVPLVRKALCTQTCSPRYREVIVLWLAGDSVVKGRVQTDGGEKHKVKVGKAVLSTLFPR